MKLGHHDGVKGAYGIVRDLTEDEIAMHVAHTKVVKEAENRLALFRMLKRNYGEFRKYVDQLLSADYKDRDWDGEELDRLLLNYLTFAYSIQEHFEVSYKRRFKKNPAMEKRYSDFIDKLCLACWPFAFILDFRGFVQHVGLGVGRYTRNVTLSSVTVSIAADPARLTKGTRHWRKSKLKPDADEIDLLPVLQEFNIQMLQSYGSFVATTFYPELVPAYEFYAKLTEEATVAAPGARMVFFEREPQIIPGEGGKFTVNASVFYPPNSLFQELGILRPKSAP